MNTVELTVTQKPSVLIVEDEWIVSLELQEYLEQMGYGIIGSVDEGKCALEKLDTHIPDVILMDIKLKGDMDGIETSQQIRKDFNVPIIFLTANTDENTLSRARATNFYGYIQKPFSSKELNLTIKCALEKVGFQQKMGKTYVKLINMISRLPVGVIFFNDAGKIYMFNDTASNISEWQENETIGFNIDFIYKTYKDSACVYRVINYSNRIISDSESRITSLFIKTRNGIVKKIVQKKFDLFLKQNKGTNSIIIFDENEISSEIRKNVRTIVHELEGLF